MSDDVLIKSNVGQNSHFRDKNLSEPHVDLEDEKSVQKWASVLHVTADELKRLVKSYGPTIKKIRLGMAELERERERKKAA